MKKYHKKVLISILVVLLGIVTAAMAMLYGYQDKIVQELVSGLNEDFDGALVIEDTNIKPFVNFPYISLAIKNVQVFEDKEDMFAPILDVSDIHIGINFWSLLKGEFKVNMLRVENGNFDIYRYTDGSFNLVKALSGKKEINELKETYNIELKRIELANLDIIKYDEATRYHVETYIENATSKFRNSEEVLQIGLQSQLILNVIQDGDSTFLTHKNFNASTELDYNRSTGILEIAPTNISLKNADFQVAGQVDVMDDFNVDIDINGNNPNFNLLIALAPEELIPTLEQYENAGNIYFNAKIEGKTLSGNQPAINAEFGCDSAYFKNPNSQKQLEAISFRGHFTNGAARDFTTMEFALDNVTAKPEAGRFEADLRVTNFTTPEIDLTINSDFDLDFLAKFLNIKRLRELDGDVSLKMKFNDIIDLQNPEKSLEEFNKSYFSELLVEDLTFMLPDYHLKFDSIDIKATMDGNHANIDYLFMNIGSSDLTIRGEIDDLPAIIHQTNDTVKSELFIYSSSLDLKEMTSNDTLNKKPFDERIENLRLDLAFKTTPQLLVNSANLPEGDFLINNFYGSLQHYPHTFRKFNAHIQVGEEDLDILSFSGKLDKSDLYYDGKLYNYPVLMQEAPSGSIEMDFRLISETLRLNDLFTYHGKNYVPEDYQKEEIYNLKTYGNAEFSFIDGLTETKIFFDQLGARLKVHEMEIRDIHGKFILQDDYVILNKMSGNIGNSDFLSDMYLYTGENDSIRKASNHLSVASLQVDFDQLSNYSSNASTGKAPEVNHDSVFNIYTVPFTDFTFEFDIGELKYHQHLIENISANLRIQKDHFVYVDTLKFNTAGGQFDIKGHFDGSNADSIYFYPQIRASNVNLEEMLYKFDNFGQDYIISDNLVGRFTGKVFGRVHVHADMVPQISDSELYLDIEIVDGVLKNYKPMDALSEYFTDKNLAHIRFDTLSNQLRVYKNVLVIPNMTINSSLGYMDISGSQNLENEMEYYFKVPLKLVGKAAWQKLFGKKSNVSDSTHIDAIQYKSDKKKYWYVNIKLEGTPDNYKVSLGKKEKMKG